MNRRIITLTLALSLGALLGSSAHAAPSVELVRGVTRVTLDAGFLAGLGAAEIAPGTIRPTTLRVKKSGARVQFPIPTGVVDLSPLTVEIPHTGGLTLSKDETRVTLSSFIIENLGGAVQLTGLVTLDGSIVGRLPLFDVALTSGPDLLPRNRTEVRADLTLTQDAADTLNGVFGSSLGPDPVGTARVVARIRDL